MLNAMLYLLYLAISVDTDDDGNSMKAITPVKKTELPKGMYKHALSAYNQRW